MNRFFRALGRIKNKKGVTLVELIMVMAIMAILGVAVMTLTTSSLGMYNKGRDLITKEEVAKLTVDFVNQKLEKVTAINVGGTGGLGTGTGRITGKKVLTNGNTKIFGADEASEKAVYGKYSVYIVFKAAKSSPTVENYDMFYYVVYVYEDGGNWRDGYSQQNYPTLINGPEITGSASAERISYSTT